MCRYNIIMVKHKNNQNYLKDIGYSVMEHEISGFTGYSYGTCNCDSFVGSMSDSTENTYSAMLAHQQEKFLEQLEHINAFMRIPGYRKKRRQYEEHREKYYNAMSTFTDEIFQWELEQIEQIEDSYSEKERKPKMEKLYQEVDILFREMEERMDYKNAQKIYFDFLHNNQLMEESCSYFFSQKEQEKAWEESAPQADQLWKSKEIEDLTYDQEETQSYVIDEVFRRVKDGELKEKEAEDEYGTFIDIFKELLKNESEIQFTTIWCEPNELKLQKAISIDTITLEDMARLSFNEVICIISDRLGSKL